MAVSRANSSWPPKWSDFAMNPEKAILLHSSIPTTWGTLPTARAVIPLQPLLRVSAAWPLAPKPLVQWHDPPPSAESWVSNRRIIVYRPPDLSTFRAPLTMWASSPRMWPVWPWPPRCSARPGARCPRQGCCPLWEYPSVHIWNRPNRKRWTPSKNRSAA